MQMRRRAVVIPVVAALAAVAAPAGVARAETTTKGCVVSGPNVINVYTQNMDFSVTVDPGGRSGPVDWTDVELQSPSKGDELLIFIPHDQGINKGVFDLQQDSGAADSLTYGTMYEVIDSSTSPCGDLKRPITVKAATKPYVSAERRGGQVKVNGTIEMYNKDYTANYSTYGRWERINRTYLDFQRYEGGRWVTKKSVLTDARGNANTGWMNYSGSSSWRVQYRGGWWLQAVTTGAVVR